MVKAASNEEKFVSILMLPDIDLSTIRDAIDIFNGYKRKGVIIAGSWDDNYWITSDEYGHYGLDFEISDEDYQQFHESTGIEKTSFIESMKAYIVFKLGTLALASLQRVVLEIKRVAVYPIADLPDILNDFPVTHSDCVNEFFTMIHTEEHDDVLETIADAMDLVSEQYRANDASQHRMLASMDSYFKFGDVHDKFWHSDIDKDERLFYFPVYLWWNLSGILPMRPREFVLTPRNCLRKRRDGYYLTVLKDTLKGKSKKKSYKISLDYKKHTHAISKRLGDLIKWYIDETDHYDVNSLETLFITDTHYAKWDHRTPVVSRYYTYANFATCLRYFFEYIVVERYGYHIVYERESSFTADDEINYIYPGDLRHLALINIIAEGGTPLVAMALAGQDNAAVSSSYFANIDKYIECKVARQYKRLNGGSTPKYALSKAPEASMLQKPYIMLSDNGRCYSTKVREHDYSDCANAMGPEGEIGWCPSCPHFRPSGMTFHNSETLKNELKAEYESLAEIVKRVRTADGNPEDIIQEVLKLRNAEYSYEQYLLELNGGNDHGKTTENQ